LNANIVASIALQQMAASFNHLFIVFNHLSKPAGGLFAMSAIVHCLPRLMMRASRRDASCDSSAHWQPVLAATVEDAVAVAKRVVPR
jgi:hypothetical protein